MHLGKRSRRNDPRTLKLARYLLPGAPGAALTAPASCDYTRGITNWGMMLNDQLGCCTIAAVGHAVQVWTANASQEVTVPDSAILSYYEQWDGYNPQNPSSDQGGVELDVLNDWRQQGFAGHSLDAYVAIELGTGGSGLGARDSGQGEALPPPALTPATQPPISSQVALAIWLFGGAYIGVQLPIRAQKQKVWDVPQNPGPDDEPGSWGGHAIFLVGYDFNAGTRDTGNGTRVTTPTLSAPPLLNQEAGFAGPSRVPQVPNPESRVPCPGTLTCITWGQLKKMTWAWFEKYCDEAYAPVSKEWIEAQGVAPSGFDLATLEADLNLVTA